MNDHRKREANCMNGDDKSYSKEPKRRSLQTEAKYTDPSLFAISAFDTKGLVLTDVVDNAKEKFVSPTRTTIAAYTMDVTTAVRDDDVEKLKNLHASGAPLDCRNRCGDSLLHIACRRGLTRTVKYLVEEANVFCNIILRIIGYFDFSSIDAHSRVLLGRHGLVWFGRFVFRT